MLMYGYEISAFHMLAKVPCWLLIKGQNLFDVMAHSSFMIPGESKV